MSNKYKFYNPDGTYFVTLTVVGWIDVFTRDVYRKIFIDSVNYCIKKKGLIVHAWVLMTNHAHMIISRTGDMPMHSILRDMKKYTSVEIIHAIENNPSESRRNWMLDFFESRGKANSNNVKFQFWQQDNHPLEMGGSRSIKNTMDYIHKNPVEHGFTNSEYHYDWSSICDYSGEKGLIEVEMI